MSELMDKAARTVGGSPSAFVMARVCGAAFTGLTAATVAVVPPSPESDASVARIRDYLIADAGGLAMSTALMGIAAMAVVGFFALVHSRLRAASRDGDLIPAAFLLAGSVVVTSTLIGLVIQAALVHQIAPTADDSTLVAFYALWDRVFHTAPAMGMAVALLAASLAGPRSGPLPRWACLVALAACALMLIDIVEDLATTGTNLGPLGIIAFGLVNVWIVGVSVTAWRHPAATTAAEG
ncbi:MAG TPA: hypothetical protein VFY84_10790 [Jiangellales bacterium]|nr:hypothetical protein [Jiangellales bacterium]